MSRSYTFAERNIMREVRESQNICCYCGKELAPEERTVDHIHPINRGGETVLENLAVCCQRCNFEKQDMTLQEYITYKSKKDNFLLDIERKIELELEQKKYYRTLLRNLKKNDEVIEYISFLINAHKEKKKKLKNLLEISDNKISMLEQEKKTRTDIFKLEIERGLIGNLNRDDSSIEFEKRLGFDIEEIMEDTIFKSIIVNSTITNSILE
ncbi:HNH endonuclease [Clostridium perfringens]|nr:HNH endonuclease [Clostridium perfringens]